MKNDDYIVVFSGGGALGAWEVGCYEKILEEHKGMKPTVVAGASAGALNAGAVFLGLSIHELKNQWLKLKKRDVYYLKFKKVLGALIFCFILLVYLLINYFPKQFFEKLSAYKLPATLYGYLASFGFWVLRKTKLSKLTIISKKRKINIVNNTITFFLGNSIFCTTPLVKTIKKIMVDKANDFEGKKMKLAISLTNLNEQNENTIAYWSPNKNENYSKKDELDEEYVLIKNKTELIDKMVGSASIPILFPPHSNYFDGGVINNQPIQAAVRLLSKTAKVIENGYLIYVIIPFPESPKKTDNIVQILMNVLETWMSQGTEKQIKTVKMFDQINDYLRKKYNDNNVDGPVNIIVFRPDKSIEEKFDINMLSFGKKADDLIQDGYQSASREFDHIKQKKKA